MVRNSVSSLYKTNHFDDITPLSELVTLITRQIEKEPSDQVIETRHSLLSGRLYICSCYRSPIAYFQSQVDSRLVISDANLVHRSCCVEVHTIHRSTENQTRWTNIGQTNFDSFTELDMQQLARASRAEGQHDLVLQNILRQWPLKWIWMHHARDQVLQRVRVLAAKS